MIRSGVTALLLALCLVACGNRLSREECQTLFAHLDELTLEHLPAEDRPEIEERIVDADVDGLKQCRRGVTWTRAQYECAMTATDETALHRCLTETPEAGYPQD